MQLETRQDAKKEFWSNRFKKMFPNMKDYETVLKMSYHGSVMDSFIDDIYDSLEAPTKHDDDEE